MKFLTSSKLSEHRYKTPEGYLVCVDAIIARTGKQEYRNNELFADSDDDSVIQVDRPYKEVFSPETVASFENKPLVDEHPDEDVNVENYKNYAVGFIRDVHEGEENGKPVLMANIIVTDPSTIEEIENGKTQLSCGYDCDILGDSEKYQANIRGNHVALCEQGRAGNARIVDTNTIDGGFQEIGNFWRKLESKNPGISKLVQEFYKTPVYQHWDLKNSMDIIYSETMFNEFMKYYKQRTGKEMITDTKTKDLDKDYYQLKKELDACKTKEDYHKWLQEVKSNDNISVEQMDRLIYFYNNVKDITDSVKDASRKAEITLWVKTAQNKKDLDIICKSLNTKYRVLKETPTEMKIELNGNVESVVDDLRDLGLMSTSLSSIRYTDSLKDAKYVVYNADDECFGSFDTKEEAKKQIQELKEFDKRHNNPFNESYRIEIEDSIKDSLSSEVRSWWERVEKANQNNSWGFNIDNSGASDEEMLSAVFDILPDLRKKDNNLYQEGKRIYNKYSKYSQYKDSIKDSDKDIEIESKIELDYRNGKLNSKKEILKKLEELEAYYHTTYSKDIISYLQRQGYIVDSVKDGRTIKYKGFTIEELEGYQSPQYVVYDKHGWNMNSHLSTSSDLRQIKREIDLGYLDDYVEDSVKDDASHTWWDLLYENNLLNSYVFINGGYGMKFKTSNAYYKAKELAIKCGYSKESRWDDGNLSCYDFRSERISNNYDSVKDVEPRTNETKEEFISRFMSETKSEYPDEKQRFAVANSYWERKDSIVDSVKDSYIDVISAHYNNVISETKREAGYYNCKAEHLGTFKEDINYRDKFRIYGSRNDLREFCKEVMGLSREEITRGIKDSIKDDYSGFLGNYGFDYLKGSGDYEYWYLKYNDEDFQKLVDRIRKEYPMLIISSNPREKTIYIQKSKYKKDSVKDISVGADTKVSGCIEPKNYDKTIKKNNDIYWLKDGKIIAQYIAKEDTTTFFGKVQDAVKDIEFKYLSEEAKKLKEELGLYKKQIGSHQYKPKGEDFPREIKSRKNQYNNDEVKEFNESINEAVNNLSQGNYDESSWNRLSQRLEKYETSEEYNYLFKKANAAIKKFINYIKTHKEQVKNSESKDSIENKPVTVLVVFDDNHEANDALKVLRNKEEFMNSDFLFDNTLKVETTDIFVDKLKKDLKLFFVKKIIVKGGR